MDDARSLIDNLELITDCCRYSEGILTEKQVRQKYHLFDESTWTALGSDEALLEKIELEKVRRVRSGAAKREKAQQLIVQAVDVLGGIALDSSANARHRIDASKALDTLAGGESQAAPAADRFVITINLGNDKLIFDKPIKPEAGRTIEHTPQDLLAVVKDDDDGNPV